MNNPISLIPKKDNLAVLSVRISTTEKQHFIDEAEKARMTVSEYFRVAIIDNETFVVQKEIMSKDKRNLIYLFNKTSNNMNQLAKSVNIAHNSGNMNEKLSLQVLRELQLIRIALHTYIESC
ncbi:plasmid mobilization protein [Photobacterium carnosum]|uniref:plasmid mobilization protein n=1 Tax=Photobacterium carnosum TaxID=2023717 RepID=UPI001E47D8D3|nr:hypothetical protein [Photobacterium carnosum]MCD9538965.1 hypothetical protein [Photobacterium carnosum]MCF2163681.1 hypothetical protein [Photobacterium carnosum]